ncbi:hypothetical protein GCM10010306_062750 [Streptomyces umbrinus]|nr:hypothetical protein GCM10010306_062750 [Streptomyces umbrinus]
MSPGDEDGMSIPDMHVLDRRAALPSLCGLGAPACRRPTAVLAVILPGWSWVYRDAMRPPSGKSVASTRLVSAW